MMGTIVRRLIVVPLVLLSLPALVVTAPLWLPICLIVDVATGLFRLPTLRLCLFGLVYLAHEWVCVGAAIYLGGRRRLRPARSDPSADLVSYRRVQAWWVSSLLGWARRLVGVRFDLPDPPELPDEGFILISRHASMVDAVLPMYLVASGLDRFVHYVLKRELRFDPALDFYGHALGNYFLSRNGNGDHEALAIAGLARRALPLSVLVIFPEGTYASPSRRARVRRSLVNRGDVKLLELADDLEHLLPPKPAGTLALLANQPELDVVVLGHVGLEGVSNLGGLRQRLPLRSPVVVRWWHHRRSSLPTEDEATIHWLNQQWRTLDRWVDSAKDPR